MNDMQTTMRSWLYWLVPLAVLVVLILWQTEWGTALHRVPPPDSGATPPPLALSLLPEYQPVALPDGSRDVVDRTLFNPTRRPAPTAIAEAAKPKMQRGQFTLQGTLMVDGKATAILRETNGGKSPGAAGRDGQRHAGRRGGRTASALRSATKPKNLRSSWRSDPTPRCSPSLPDPATRVYRGGRRRDARRERAGARRRRSARGAPGGARGRGGRRRPPPTRRPVARPVAAPAPASPARRCADGDRLVRRGADGDSQSQRSGVGGRLSAAFSSRGGDAGAGELR